MGIIEERKAKRDYVIGEIVRAIGLSVVRGVKPDEKLLVMEVCVKFKISVRTAKEYVQLAIYKANVKDEELMIQEKVIG